MKKLITIGVCIALLPFLFLSCSGSDDNEQPIIIQQTIAPGSDARPDWQSPQYAAFEQTMSVQVLMQHELEPYVTTQDLLCATIEGEVRGLTPPTVEDSLIFFPLTVAANGGGEAVNLSYYCDQLHRIFTIQWTTFDASVSPMGEGGIYRPQFIK